MLSFCFFVLRYYFLNINCFMRFEFRRCCPTSFPGLFPLLTDNQGKRPGNEVKCRPSCCTTRFVKAVITILSTRTIIQRKKPRLVTCAQSTEPITTEEEMVLVYGDCVYYYRVILEQILLFLQQQNSASLPAARNSCMVEDPSG